MDCPVCNKKDIGLDVAKCPQCDSDLSTLNILKELRSSLNENKFKYSLIIFSSIFIVFLIMGYFSINNKDFVIKSMEENQVVLLDSLSLLVNKLSSIDSIKYSNANHIITYNVRRGDNLWDISRYYFNDGNQYHKIVDYNKLNSSRIYVGQTLKINLK